MVGGLCHLRHPHTHVVVVTNRRPCATKPLQPPPGRHAGSWVRERRIAGLFIKREPTLVSHQVEQACNSLAKSSSDVPSEHPGCRGKQAHTSLWATLLVLAPSTAPVQRSPVNTPAGSVPFESVWRPCPVCAR